jgi:hypothetical protein
MKILKPISTSQTILIQPRLADGVSSVSIQIRKDGEGISETVSSSSCALLGNFLEIDFASTILKEGETYSFSVLFDGDIIYKDKIYATAKDNFTIKHVTVQDNYTSYNEVDDNTYIIR